MTNEQNRNMFMLTLTVTVIITMGSIGSVSISLPQQVYAQSSTSSNANDFGNGASQLGQSGQMGTHAQAGGAAGNPPNFEDNQPGRFGIGNVGSQLCPGERLTPGELADVLNNLQSTGKIVCP